MESRRPDSKQVLTVSQITGILKETLETVFSTVHVQGEVSGFKASSQGHLYFTLKDAGACISCVIWRSKAMFLPQRPKDGDKITVSGQLTVYEPRGQYQIVCNSIEFSGTGSILAELERRKKLYEAEGLFDPSRRRPIPSHPKRVGIITSPTGAAIKDIMNVLERRSSGVDIIIFPAVVQGPEAASQIARRIAQANEFCAADVLIVGRGGGSIEDLLPFSEDCVVRAVSASQIPVISAVGHEIDWALCDYAADLRAPTPSAAAELVSGSRSEQLDQVQSLEKSMKMLVLSRIRDARLVVSQFSLDRVRHVLDSRLSSVRMKSDELVSRMNALVSSRIQNSKQRAQSAEQSCIHAARTAAMSGRARAEKDIEALKALSPLSVLDRGYSIVSGIDRRTISKATDLKAGTEFTVRFSDGRIAAVSKGEADGRQ